MIALTALVAAALIAPTLVQSTLTAGPASGIERSHTGGTYLPTPVICKNALYVLNDKGIFSRHNAETAERTYQSRVAPGGIGYLGIEILSPRQFVSRQMPSPRR